MSRESVSVQMSIEFIQIEAQTGLILTTMARIACEHDVFNHGRIWQNAQYSYDRAYRRFAGVGAGLLPSEQYGNLCQQLASLERALQDRCQH